MESICPTLPATKLTTGLWITFRTFSSLTARRKRSSSCWNSAAIFFRARTCLLFWTIALPRTTWKAAQASWSLSVFLPTMQAISVWVLTQQIISIAKPFRENVAAIVLQTGRTKLHAPVRGGGLGGLGPWRVPPDYVFKLHKRMHQDEPLTAPSEPKFSTSTNPFLCKNKASWFFPAAALSRLDTPPFISCDYHANTQCSANFISKRIFSILSIFANSSLNLILTLETSFGQKPKFPYSSSAMTTSILTRMSKTS